MPTLKDKSQLINMFENKNNITSLYKYNFNYT